MPTEWRSFGRNEEEIGQGGKRWAAPSWRRPRGGHFASARTKLTCGRRAATPRRASGVGTSRTGPSRLPRRPRHPAGAGRSRTAARRPLDASPVGPAQWVATTATAGGDSRGLREASASIPPRAGKRSTLKSATSFGRNGQVAGVLPSSPRRLRTERRRDFARAAEIASGAVSPRRRGGSSGRRVVASAALASRRSCRGVGCPFGRGRRPGVPPGRRARAGRSAPEVRRRATAGPVLPQTVRDLGLGPGGDEGDRLPRHGGTDASGGARRAPRARRTGRAIDPPRAFPADDAVAANTRRT